MEFGVHLPLISIAGEQRSLDDLLAFTETARDLGYTHLCANDHLVFSRPWLDGPTALAAVLARSGQMTLATTVTVPVLRGPAATAKILAAIDLLSGGRLVVGLGPGSSARDYELVGVQFEERWKRLDEAVQTLRAYWRADDVAFEGAFYSTAGFSLAPDAGAAPRSTDLDRQLGIGGGTETRGAPCRRLARLWLQHDPGTVRPSLVGRPGRGGGARTRWCAVPERHRNDVVLRHRGPGPRRRGARPTCSRRCSIVQWSSFARYCRSARRRNARRSLLAYARAGAQRVFLWPLADERTQLEVFRERVMPLLDRA